MNVTLSNDLLKISVWGRANRVKFNAQTYERKCDFFQ